MTAGVRHEARPSVLVIGYGNPGRLDDGLGPALIVALEGVDLPHVTLDADYQLTVEDAAAVAEHDVVIFVDAAVQGPEPFEFKRLEAAADTGSFSTHSVSPQAVLGLAQSCFQASPRAYVLAIRGYEFNAFGERLGGKAQTNLAAALAFLTDLLRSGELADPAYAPAIMNGL